VLYGRNQHHIVEAVFKAATRALSQAVRLNERIQGVMSTKGKL
jgi:imidazoleglycerol-phosphate dehydratase